VDLPEPVCPISATNSPLAIERDTSLMAVAWKGLPCW